MATEERTPALKWRVDSNVAMFFMVFATAATLFAGSQPSPSSLRVMLESALVAAAIDSPTAYTWGMRVIAGTFRSRLLVSPRGTATRPTSDRLRETLFNILAMRIEGCHFVDLYAGTGAVGIEAVSRGAAHVWFAENSEPALASIKANFAALNIVRNVTVEDRGTGALLQRLAKAGKPIDIVFLDPPYEAEAEYEGTLSFFGSVRGRQMLAPDALIVAEHGSKVPLPERFGGLEQYRHLRQGDAALTFYSVREIVVTDGPSQA